MEAGLGRSKTEVAPMFGFYVRTKVLLTTRPSQQYGTDPTDYYQGLMTDLGNSAGGAATS